jgi:hypothetical protein
MISSASLCNLMDQNIEWLKKRIEQYRSEKNDIFEAVEDFSEVEKLGQGFTLFGPLEEVHIGNGAVPRPIYVNKNLNVDYKAKLIKLLREYVDSFAWSYSEMHSHNLNRATPKEEYPMLIADMLVNDSCGHKVISFLDGNAGYNQIFMAEEDMYKMAFRCPSFVGLFEWVVMTFGLKIPGQLTKGQ